MLEEKAAVAVVGAGISGITAAYLLQRRFNVTLFESSSALGGHAHTVTVDDPMLGEIGIDMGFIVLNNRNYPLLSKLFLELDVAIQSSEMSFGFYCERTGFAYSGMSLNGLFANRKNIISPTFYRFLNDLKNFSRDGLTALANGELRNLTLGQFLKIKNVSPKLIVDYLIPMGSAIWSCAEEGVLNYPALSFLNFFKHHGLLEFTNRPQWQTVVGGSRSYIQRFEKQFNGKIKTNSRVKSILRNGEPVVQTESSEEKFSAVVLATHAPTSLKLLESPSEIETEVLSPWKYTQNRVTLHTDKSYLPPNKRAWASWNYKRKLNPSLLPSVSYWMNNLQSLQTSQTYCVTLNEEIPADKTIKSEIFEHPLYNPESISAQHRLHEIQGTGGVYYCGAYFGSGFHEDGCRSGKDVASLLGVTW